MSETSERRNNNPLERQFLAPWIAFLSSILLVLVYIGVSFFVTRGDTVVEKSDELFVTFCSESDTKGLPEALIAADGCPNTVTAFFAFEEIDVAKRTVKLWMRLYPQGEQGIALFNGGYFNKTLDVGYSAIGEGNWDVPSREWVGGKSIELPLDSLVPEAGYPFDSYSGHFNILINEAVSGAYVPVSVTFSQKQVSGFVITPQLLAPEMTVGNSNLRIYEEGLGGFKFEIHRSSSQQMHFGILIAIIIIGAISSLVTTIAVARRKRPPSLAILAWLATYLFALIQVRGEFPGSPALGVSVDRYLTFPAIAIIMVLIVANVVSWLRRNDWDSENQDLV